MMMMTMMKPMINSDTEGVVSDDDDDNDDAYD